jgi:hypothetical protein
MRQGQAPYVEPEATQDMVKFLGTIDLIDKKTFIEWITGEKRISRALAL